MITAEEFQKLKKKAEQVKSEINRAEGQLTSHLENLRREYGVDSLEEAEEKLTDLESGLKEAEKEFEAAKTAFQEKYGSLMS